MARRLIGLTPANRTLPEGGLGYGGLTLTNPDKLVGLPVRGRIFHGIIGLWEDGLPTYYHDLHHVEDWLIELARQRGYGAILDQLIGNNGWSFPGTQNGHTHPTSGSALGEARKRLGPL